MDSKRLRAQAEVLSRLTRALADASTDPRILIARLVDETATALDVFCRFLMPSESGAWLESVASCVPPTIEVSAELIRLLDRPIDAAGDSLPAQAARRQVTMHVPQVTERDLKARFPDPSDHEVVLRFPTKGALLVPVVGRGGLHGVLSLVRGGEGALAFDRDDERFAEQLAAHAALALTNAKLMAEAHERAARLQLVSDLTREVTAASGNFQQLLDALVRSLGETIADGCIVRLVGADGRSFNAGGAVYDRDPELARIYREVLLGLGGSQQAVLASRVLESGASLRIPRVALPVLLDSAPPPFRDLLERLAPSTLMAVPLRQKGPPIGVLMLARRQGGAPFSADDQKLVEDLVTHATVAMNNARLIEETERTAERLRTLTAVAAELDAAVDEPEAIVEKVARRLSELVGGTCIVQLVSFDRETIEPHEAVVGPDPEVVRRIRAVLGPRKASGVTLRVLQGETVLLTGTPSEIAARISERARAEVEALGISGLLALPLRVGPQIIGVAILSRYAGEPYTTEDLQFAQDLVTHAALAIRNGRLLGKVQHELAERARAELALRESEEQLRHAQKMEAVGRLAGGVAHDFNNLLTVVLHSCGFIAEALPVGSPMRDDIEQIRLAGDRAARLTRQLLAFSRQQVLQPEVLDLGKHVGNMRPLLERLLGEHCTLVTRFAPNLHKVKADGSHIEQIVMNLAINARDAMCRGGTLTIETANVMLEDASHGTVPGAYVMLEVSDTGEGMTKETQERMFEPFFTTKPVGKGTGLGLSTVFGIVKQNGGTISSTSEVGQGTTFRIYLPRTEEPRRITSLPIEVAEPRGNGTILLVEDEDAVRRVVIRVLARKGYRVIETRNGRDALETFEQRASEIDVVLTDVMMPVMGGGELAKHLLARQPTLPVLFMSGYIDDSILEQEMIEPSTLIPKPLNLEVLLAKIRDALDTTRA